MISVPMLDLKKQYQSIRSEIKTKIMDVLSRQEFILGKETEKFERSFARYCEKKYCIGLGSGTDALFVALKIMGIKKDDEVIVPAFTFIATAEVVSILGGKVVFCDVDSQTGLMDPKDFQKRITKKTRFVIPVHLYGQIAPINEIKSIISGKHIQIIEDAAQAHGATYRKTHSPIEKLAIYSFYPAKNLGAFGDAGAIITNSKRLRDKAMLMRNHGQKKGKKYHHQSIGFNFRLDEIQAAVLNVKLMYLTAWTKKRQKIANLYKNNLRDINGVKILKTLPENEHVYHQFAIRVKNRDRLQMYLKKQGIDSRVHYPLPLHLQPAYEYLGNKNSDFPAAEMLPKEILCLPIYPELQKKHVMYITDKIKIYFGP